MSSNGTTPEQIAADIERQREQLARTVDELHARLDVKARLADRLTTASGRPRPELVAVAVGAVLATALLLWRRRR